MKKNSFKRCTAALMASVMVASAMPVANFAVNAAGNIVKNSEFEKNAADWAIYKESGGVGFITAKDGKLCLTVSDQSSLNYGVQLFYDNPVKLYKNGVYRFSYEISASTPRYVESMIQMNGGDYRSYTWKGVEVGTEPKVIDYEFVMEEDTDIMTKMCFNCGLQKQDGVLPEHEIYLDNVVLELVDDSNVDYDAGKPYEAPIITNQIGFRPDAKKTAVFRATNGGSFSVVNVDTNKVVYTGEMVGPVSNALAGETNFTADFSAVKEPGKYVIKSEGLDDSYEFVIGDDVYANALDASVKMLYLQRCGTEVVDAEFGHPSCHDSIATVYKTDTKIDVSGGWHDAGDYGRYIVAAAKAVADLLYAYDTAPELYGDNLGIPESGNGTPDILDEVRYELEWMMKMQDQTDGGVYHKVTCDTFPGYVMPEDETKPLIVMPKSTTATADFAASMAMAYEFYKDIDADFADKCLEAGKKAYGWAIANPKVLYSNPADVVTGEYGDKATNDEIYWAKAQMYRATGDASYLDGISIAKGLDWSTVGDYGNIALLTMDGIDKTSTAYKDALGIVVSQADDFVEASEAMPYGVALESFNWGSNMTVANAGIILATAYNLTADEKYINASTAQLDYLLGTNPNAMCFFTGYGTVSPLYPHHRPSMAVGKCMPGMLVGGVNSGLEDPAAEAYCSDNAPAKCWVDNAESYSTNEITIYWNSPLTYLLSLTETAKTVDVPTTNPATTEAPVVPSIPATLYGDANNDGIISIADSTAILQSLGNADKYGLTDQGAANADVDGVAGITANDALAIKQYDAKLIAELPIKK